MQINSIMSINSVMPLTNLTYVFDIQDIRVTGTVPLGCRLVSHGFITHYGTARLLTGYKQSNSEHNRYGPAGLLIGVTHQYNSVPLGCRPISHGFITHYGPAGLLTGYKQSNSEHY